MKRLYLLLAVFLSAMALRAQSVLEQPVSIVGKGLSLEEALYRLSDQEGVNLSFSNDILPLRRLNIDIREGTLAQALEELLRGTALGYRQVGSQVVIFLPDQHRFTISGFLRDARTGERLISANIQDLHTGMGAVTNEYGFYSLTLPAGQASLSYSYLGYGAERREGSSQRVSTMSV